MEGKRVSVEELKLAMAVEFERLAEQVAAAMNAARDGRIIADTEELFDRPTPRFANNCTRRRSASCRTGRRLFLPRPPGLQNKGPPPTTHLTVNGRLMRREARRLCLTQAKAEQWREELMGWVWE
jgi:hypothetical protein